VIPAHGYFLIANTDVLSSTSSRDVSLQRRFDAASGHYQDTDDNAADGVADLQDNCPAEANPIPEKAPMKASVG
jgi:hypothetical protein